MNYRKVYQQLVDHAKSRKLSKKDCYIEQHHIIPRSEGGTDDKYNLVNLTAREHYIAHLLLAKIYGDDAMHSAVVFMQTGHLKDRTFKFNSHLYSKLRNNFSALRSAKMSGDKNPFFGKHSPMFGRHHSANAKQRISLSHKGKHLSEETKRKLSELNKGKHQSEEVRNKISTTLKGKPHPHKGCCKSATSKKKISAAFKGRHFYNNGVVTVYVEKCPDGFVVGRLKKVKNV